MSVLKLLLKVVIFVKKNQLKYVISEKHYLKNYYSMKNEI